MILEINYFPFSCFFTLVLNFVCCISVWIKLCNLLLTHFRQIDFLQNLHINLLLMAMSIFMNFQRSISYGENFRSKNFLLHLCLMHKSKETIFLKFYTRVQHYIQYFQDRISSGEWCTYEIIFYAFIEVIHLKN